MFIITLGRSSTRGRMARSSAQKSGKSKYKFISVLFLSHKFVTSALSPPPKKLLRDIDGAVKKTRSASDNCVIILATRLQPSPRELGMFYHTNLFADVYQVPTQREGQFGQILWSEKLIRRRTNGRYKILCSWKRVHLKSIDTKAYISNNCYYAPSLTLSKFLCIWTFLKRKTTRNHFSIHQFIY